MNRSRRRRPHGGPSRGEDVVKTSWTVSALAASAAIWASACAGDEPEVDCDSEPGCVEAGDDVDVEIERPATPGAPAPQGPMTVEYLVSGCGLALPGACKGRRGCGHVHLAVPDCGVTAESHRGEAVVDLGQCDPDKHAVFVRDGAPIWKKATVHVEAKKKKEHRKGDDRCD